MAEGSVVDGREVSIRYIIGRPKGQIFRIGPEELRPITPACRNSRSNRKESSPDPRGTAPDYTGR